jgi:hypothetical protein
MADFEELEFVIPAYTPETMPLNRLLEYLEQIGAVIGAPAEMHLVRIEHSSTKPVFRVPVPSATRARDTALAISRGDGTAKQRGAYERIRKMVRKDGGKNALLNDHRGVVLSFPAAPEDVAIFGIRQAGHFDGLLNRVGGSGDFSSIQMQELNGDVISGFSASRYLAKEMAALLYEPLRVHGQAIWDRSTTGRWKLTSMHIQSYERLGDDSLEDVVKELKAAPVNWPDDADQRLQRERDSVQ